MFLRNVCRAVVMLVVCLAGGLAISLPAQAAESCNTVIMDDAKILGSGANKVVAAAQSLQTSVNADVHVVTTPTLKGYTSIEKFNAHLVETCPSWQNSNGGAKSTLLIYTISMDHKLGISYGEAWSGAFSGRNSEVRIYTDIMAPKFRDGDFAGGFVAGMEESQRVIDNYLHPDSNNPAPNNPDAGGSDTTDNASEPVDINWKGVGIGAGIFVLLFILGGGYFWLSERKRADAERKVMQQRALSARDATTEITNELGDKTATTLRGIKLKKYSAVSDEIAEQLRQLDKQITDNYAAATNGMLAAASASGSADDNDLVLGVYEQLAERYERTLASAQAARNAEQQFNALCADIDNRQRQAEKTIGELQARHDALVSTIAKLSEQGIKIDAIQAPLTKAAQQLTEAKEHQGDLKVLTDLDQTEHALAKAEAAESQLAQWRSELEKGVPALTARIDETTSQVEEGQQCFQRISTTYVESSWESIRGNGTEAQKRLDKATALRDDVTFDAGLDRQRWEDAINNLQAANGCLDEASSLLTSITKLETNLANAKARAPKEIDDAAADIAKAQQYLAANQSDVHPTHRKELQAALEDLDKARKELAKAQPDYLRVVKQALAANKQADNIFAAAASEHETAERLRRQASSMLEEASASISKAREYIQDHHGDISHGAKEKLSNAETYYARAQSATDAATRLSEATNAGNYADSAYDKAKRDHRDAEDERDEERRRRNDSYGGGFGGGVIIGSTTSGGWGSSSGSSSGGGGFGGGLGGSSGSWGGGGGGGLGGSGGGW